VVYQKLSIPLKEKKKKRREWGNNLLEQNKRVEGKDGEAKIKHHSMTFIHHTHLHLTKF
jgi:hypothetical protein